MKPSSVSPVVLVILDGWGYRESSDGNAIAAANTPVMDSLWKAYPRTLIRTSGKDVGLPTGQMGNSEVGHLNLGAGRVVPQELVRISDAVEDGSIQSNPAIEKLCQEVRTSGGKLHLIGLCSDGGVHSHLNHLLGLLDLAKAKDLSQVCIHAITDGRDTNPTEGVRAIAKIEEHIAQVGIGKIVTISGRYYAMDRDRRWERVEKAYRVMTDDAEIHPQSATEAIAASYQNEITDEFILPVRIAPGAIEPGDGVIFFNFRPDRARQLTYAFVNENFDGFDRPFIRPLSFLTFTQYDPTLPVLVAFEPQNLSNILGEVVSRQGLKQFRTAETEKYAHVTYFFNGGLETPFEGEDRELVMSPMVPTYDQAPAMSAEAVTDVAIAAIEKGIYSLVVINYANPDMVGHTGIYPAAVQAIETVDRCLGRLLESISRAGGTALITADHGNAEYMWDDNGEPWTAHTTNPVPFILVEGEGVKIPGHGTEVSLRDDGRLADIAPTILEILGIPQPSEMTGRSMIQPAEVEVRRNRTPVGLGL
ncbi:MAG TPA: 2,3-bisphosphoglycerate-independent phosphoglycerate mutase [Oscillatoriales cyanobacterium M59_W2019_021]|nr:2,3-bisphosphoglycerate-independent phosphoglycerate mutase [Oscillatoriales cyanobacterium M4454_W2019_049]HIK49388.1 2,3-bisphosphoglycerate-independent phosphoglycerate mutase [Oscillatoriales cyanobacterium M59_W2019_021]